MLFSTLQDFWAMAWRSAAPSFPAPGISRSITNFGIHPPEEGLALRLVHRSLREGGSLGEGGKHTLALARRATPGRGGQLHWLGERRLERWLINRAVGMHLPQRNVTPVDCALQIAPRIEVQRRDARRK